MNDTISTINILPAWVSEHITSVSTRPCSNLAYQYNISALVLVGVPLLVTLVILLRDLFTNSIAPAEIESRPPPPELEVQAQSHQSTRPIVLQCSNVTTQTTAATQDSPTPNSSQIVYDHLRVAEVENEHAQQRADWLAAREGLRSQLLQARTKIELLLKANQIEIRTRARGKFLAALEVVGSQESIAEFSARQERKIEAFKTKVQQQYDQRLEQSSRARSATANVEQEIRKQAEQDIRVLTEQRENDLQQLATTSARLQELERQFPVREQELTAELNRLRDELEMASQQRDNLLRKQDRIPEAAEPLCASTGLGTRRASSAILSPVQPVVPTVKEPAADPSTEAKESEPVPLKQPNSFNAPVTISPREIEAIQNKVPSSPPAAAPTSSLRSTSGRPPFTRPTLNQYAESSRAHARRQLKAPSRVPPAHDVQNFEPSASHSAYDEAQDSCVSGYAFAWKGPGAGQTPTTADLENAFTKPFEALQDAGRSGKAPRSNGEAPVRLSPRRSRHPLANEARQLKDDEHSMTAKDIPTKYRGPAVEEGPATPGLEGFGGSLPADGTATLEDNRRAAIPYASSNKRQKEDLRQPRKAQKQRPVVGGTSRPSTYQRPVIESLPPTPGIEGFGGTLPADGTATMEENRRTKLPYAKYATRQREDLRPPVKLQKPQPKQSAR